MTRRDASAVMGSPWSPDWDARFATLHDQVIRRWSEIERDPHMRTIGQTVMEGLLRDISAAADADVAMDRRGRYQRSAALEWRTRTVKELTERVASFRGETVPR